jgi:hypothetical protein
LIAGEERQILNDRSPFGYPGAKERNVSLDESQSSHSRNRRRVVWFVVLICVGVKSLAEGAG